jgi:tetratricopeptide (TPR) repeat protein
MDQKIHAKTFIHALSVLHQDRKVLYKFMNDKRLTVTEKKILKCWGFLRESKHQDIIETLTSLPPVLDQVVESQKLLILGITYLNKGEPKLAETYLKEARQCLDQFPILRRLIFVANLNLFLTLHIQKNKFGMEEALEKMMEHTSEDATEKINIQRCQFILAKFIGDFEKAEQFFKYLLKVKPEMGANLKLSFVIDEFDYYIKLEEDQKAVEALEEFKKLRSFNHSAYYQYRLLLLNHIMKNTPLYFTDLDLKTIPLVFNQMKVIKFLEEKNMTEARIYWAQLTEINPEIYQENFNYQGDKCLFSRALQKHKTSENGLPLKLPDQKDKALLKILRNSRAPILKSELFETIWGEAPFDKEELNKLSQLVSRVKSKYGLDIKYKKGCYFLEQKKKIS